MFDCWYSIAEVKEDKANLAFRLFKIAPCCKDNHPLEGDGGLYLLNEFLLRLVILCEVKLIRIVYKQDSRNS